MESPFEVNENSEKRFYLGKINKIIRLYAYLQEGLNQANQWKYVVLAIYGIAFLTHIESYLIMGLMFLTLIPILMFVGYLWFYRGKKSDEYFKMKHTSIYSKYNIQMTEKQMEYSKKQIDLLENILKKLNN